MGDATDIDDSQVEIEGGGLRLKVGMLLLVQVILGLAGFGANYILLSRDMQETKSELVVNRSYQAEVTKTLVELKTTMLFIREELYRMREEREKERDMRRR